MSLNTLIFLEVVVDLATVALSLWALKRYLPSSWWAALGRIVKRHKRVASAVPANASIYGPSGHPSLPKTADRCVPADPMNAYGQIPLLAASGLGASQIVQKLGLTRGEVELALKMGRIGRTNANG